MPQLRRLLDLSVKYTEIAPHVAELAFKLGKRDLGNQIVRMGLEGDTPGVEYYFVVSNTARRESRFEDAFAATEQAIDAYAAREDAPADDGVRLLHLIRTAFAALLFDVGDPRAHPEFTAAVRDKLPGLASRLEGQPLYHVLLAQAQWSVDEEASEASWEKAASMDDAETVWNARGTWYKDALRDVGKAEATYRKGLEAAPHSALLQHNLAQLLVEKASAGDINPDHARGMLRQADEALRAALREDSPKGLRRHIHSTRDRLMELRNALGGRNKGGQGKPRGNQPRNQGHKRTEAVEAEAPKGPPPEVGATVKGRVRSLAGYGAFVALESGHTGLLHVSEIAHGHVKEPGDALTVGDEIELKVLDVQSGEGSRTRIGLSRRALLPAPKGGGGEGKGKQARGQGRAGDRGPREGDRKPRREDRPPRREGPSGGGRPPQKQRDERIASLGEMLLAKLDGQRKS